ncbi:unnamed protein product [Arabidopsis halleri]
MDDEAYEKVYKLSHYDLLFRLNSYAIHDCQNVCTVP